jgi:thiamine kinase-like enzyme
MLWEKLYAENLPKLQLRVREYAAREVLEFDSVDDLLHFDTDFLENVDSEAVNNIVAVLKCSPSDIKEIFILKKGLTNNSFRFRVGEKRYVYRHPGAGTEAIISRRSEKFSEEQAFRLGLDETYIYMDEVKGWKIAHYVENNRDFDYHNGEDVQKIIKLIRKLHDAGISSLYEYDMFAESEKILSLLKEGDKKDFTDFEKLRAKIKNLYELAEQDHVKKCLCHVDCYAPNFLTDGVKMQLIDWEYSGFSDPAGDIGTMICCSDYDEQEAEDLLRLYFGGAMSDVEERHWKAYIAIAAYYWFVWALYKESIGNHVGEYLLLWYRYAKKYVDIAGKLYGV